MPEWSMVSLIEASPHDAASAFAAIDRHKLDDFKPLIYRTHDGGKSWTRIVTGIPEGAYVRAVREDPKRKGLLYAGTELGVYVSFDDGAHWRPLQLNLPVTPVHDLAVKDDDLIAATHGRSFWILDDVTPLRQIDAAVATPEVRLYRPQPAYHLHYPSQVNRRRPVGENPPKGAVIDFFLKNKPAPEEQITLEILDAQGKVLRKLSNHRKEKFEQPPEWTDREPPQDVLPAEAGMNRFVWDLRVEDPTQIPGAFYGDEGPRGPTVIPGSYAVRLTVRGATQSAPLEVIPDPRLKGLASAADLAAHWDLVTRTTADIEALHRGVNQVRKLRADFATLKGWVGAEPAGKAVVAATADFEARMAPIEAQLLQVSMKASEDSLRYPVQLNEQYDTFSATIDTDDVAPTAPQQAVFGELHGRLMEQLGKWQALLTTELPALNARMQQAGVPRLEAGAGD